MKKMIAYFVLILFLFLIFGCIVDDNKGLIRVENRTKYNLNWVYIGETLIASYVAPGSYVDYWYYNEIKGRLSTKGVAVSENIKSWKLNLQKGYWVTISAGYDDNGNNRVTINVDKFGSDNENFGVDDWTD